MASYVAAKAGLEGLARAMQMELEGTGVRVGIVRPGPSSTEQGTTWDAEDVDHRDRRPSGARWGLLRHDGALRPADVAAAVARHGRRRPRGTHLTLIEVEPEAPTVRRTHIPGGQP